MTLSRRIQEIDISGVRRMFDLARKCKNPCNLSIGQPDFDVPEAVKQATVAAMEAGKNGYTQTQGIDPLREAISTKYGVSPEETLITSAVSGGFLLALMSTCDVGDEVIIPDPYFVMWPDLLKVNGIKPLYCDTYPDFRWKQSKLEALISPKTRAIVLSSPANPTGIAASEEELTMIAKIAAKHDLWVIYDEIYEEFIYEKPHLRMNYPKTITLGGLSKSHSMTGWRLGWAVGPKAVIDQMLKLQQYTFVCAPSIVQWGALEALQVSMQSQIGSYAKKRDYVWERLHEQYELVKPDGAFYFFIKIPGSEGADAFVQRALQKELILSSGTTFSRKDTHFRLSFAAPDEILKQGCDLLLELAGPRGLSPYFVQPAQVEVL